MPIQNYLANRGKAAELAWAAAAPGAGEAETKLLIPHVEAMIDEAVRGMIEQLIKTDKYYYLQNTFSGTVSGGIAQLADKTIIGQTIKPSMGGRITHNSFLYPLVYVPNLRDLVWGNPASGDLGYYTIRGGGLQTGGPTIYCANGDGTNADGTISVLCCQYVNFETLPQELEDEFIATLADMAREKLLLAKATERFIGRAPAITDQPPSGGGT